MVDEVEGKLEIACVNVAPPSTKCLRIAGIRPASSAALRAVRCRKNSRYSCSMPSYRFQTVNSKVSRELGERMDATFCGGSDGPPALFSENSGDGPRASRALTVKICCVGEICAKPARSSYPGRSVRALHSRLPGARRPHV